MPRFSKETISAILENADIIEHIGKSVKLTKKGRDHQGLCPFHQEKTPSFTVSQSKKFFYCFGCHKHGNVIDFTMYHLQMSFAEAVKHLAETYQIQIEQESPENLKESNNKHEIYKINTYASNFYIKNLKNTKSAQDYITSRGINSESIEKFKLGYAGPSWHALYDSLKNKTTLIDSCGLFGKRSNRVYDRLRDRIVFPIHDTQGRLSGFGGRSLSDDNMPKYLNSPDTPTFFKSNILYGLYQCLQAKKNEKIVIVEGYIDVIMMHQAGLPCAVASLGTAFTTQHLKLAQRYALKEIVYCFDGDAAGQRAMQKAIDTTLPLIDDRHRFKFLVLPAQEDPDSLINKHGAAHFEKEIDQALPLETVLHQRWSSDLKLEQIQDQAQYLKRARHDLSQCKTSFFKKLMIDKLAEKYPITQPEREAHMDSGKTEQHQEPSQPVSGWIECLACMLWHPDLITGFIDSLSTIKSALPKDVITTLDSLNEYANHKNTATLLENSRDDEKIRRWLVSALKLTEPQNPMAFIESYKLYLKKRVLEKHIKQLFANKNRTHDEQKTLNRYIKLKHAINNHKSE